MRGTVLSWYPERGFGFVISEDRKDYFLHVRSIVDHVVPRIGDVVEFELAESRKPGQRPEAVNATIVVEKGSVAVKS